MTRAPHGSWRSPITAAEIAGASVRLAEPRLDGNDVYWLETRPTEQGRTAIVRARNGTAPETLLPSGYSARSRAQEYGGGSFAVRAEHLWFVHDQDQCIYGIPPGSAPVRLTQPDGLRFADLTLDPARQRLLAVCEDHRRGGEPAASLVALAAAGGPARTLVSGSDFYSSPRPSPDGGRLAWLAWQHPDMPWDGAELWVAALDAAGLPDRPQRLAGAPGAESVFQPDWGPDGSLYFASDRDGWWNLYRWDGIQISQVTREAAEFGAPQWTFGMSLYGFSARQQLLAACTHEGCWSLKEVALPGGPATTLSQPFSHIESLVVAGERAAMLAASAEQAPAIVQLRTDHTPGRVLRRSSEPPCDEGYLSRPEPISFRTGGGDTAHALYYPPRNRDFEAPADEKPPLIVKCHGGPTSATATSLDLRIQFWTSRGFAVLDVNYRGSSGYGRAYRERLYGNWGVYDVEDCVSGARHLAERSLADASRMAIRGGSAGGYTVLCALAFHDVFRAGASYYGIGDLEALNRDTHKFESRYTAKLIGTSPEALRARSPLFHADRIACPVIFFQGLEDKVVPPEQTRHMAAALKQRGVPVACLEFEGEAHGFRRAATIQRALQAELYFLARIFGFTPAGVVQPLAIDNLDRK